MSIFGPSRNHQQLVNLLNQILTKVGQIMSDQSHLDSDVAELTAAVAAITAEIAALKTANPSVDFTGLDAAVASVQGLEPPASPPVAPTP